jgi:hypothetical protein
LVGCVIGGIELDSHNFNVATINEIVKRTVRRSSMGPTWNCAARIFASTPVTGWQYSKTESGTDSHQNGRQSGHYRAGTIYSELRILSNSLQAATRESGGDSSCIFCLQLSASLSIKGCASLLSESLPYMFL